MLSANRHHFTILTSNLNNIKSLTKNKYYILMCQFQIENLIRYLESLNRSYVKGICFGKYLTNFECSLS
jgi:uncharacterized membrane protein